jgi:succinoglycan biosynthesis protein ExoA
MPDRVRILHLRSSIFIGGPERQILSYCALKSERVERQTIATFVDQREGSVLIAGARAAGIATLSLPTDSLKAISQLVDYVKAERIDVICGHGYKADILGLIAARLAKAKFVPFLRGWTSEDPKVRFFEALDRASLPFADRIVCLSSTHAAEIRNSFGRDTKIRVVRNACPAEKDLESVKRAARLQLEQRFSLAGDDLLVACAGRLSPEKGTRYFLEAAVEIATAIPRARFFVFGDGPLRSELENSAAARSLADRLIFTGRLPEFPTLLPEIDLLINPSLKEQAPNVLLEAMGAAVACVATDAGAVAEISGESGTMLLTPRGDAHALAQASIAVLRDPGLASRLAQRGYQQLLKNYSIERQHQEFEDLIDELQSGEVPVESRSQEKLPPSTPSPFVSIVLPVRNEEEHIASLLDSLLAQDYDAQRFEILVCDGLSNDRTCDIVSDYQVRTGNRVRLIHNRAQRSGPGRNCGVRESRGDVIVFVDGHCALTDNRMLSNVARIFESTIADVICRPQPLDATKESPVQRVVSAARRSVLGHGRDSTIYDLDRRAYVAPDSSGAIYRKTVFDSVGFYDESFDACEDVEFNVRCRKAGMLAYTSPDVQVLYEARRTFTGLWKQMVRYGTGRARLVRKHPDTFSIAAIAPALLLAGSAVLLTASLFSSAALWCTIGIVALYSIAIAASSLSIASEHGFAIGIRAPLAYLCIHGGLGWGFLREILSPAALSAPATSSPGESVTQDASRAARVK